jgi:outer membrane protein TolC
VKTISSDLRQQRDESRNALVILLSRPPGQYPAERAFLDIQQSVPVAQRLPLDVIARRPDVQSAEMNLRAALAGSDVARLSFYPSLTLNASLNAGAAVFQQWFSNPARTLGSALDLPFIQWNKVRLTIEKSDLDVQTAAINSDAPLTRCRILITPWHSVLRISRKNSCS